LAIGASFHNELGTLEEFVKRDDFGCGHVPAKAFAIAPSGRLPAVARPNAFIAPEIS
jgi:hypothetical protein